MDGEYREEMGKRGGVGGNSKGVKCCVNQLLSNNLFYSLYRHTSSTSQFGSVQRAK